MRTTAFVAIIGLGGAAILIWLGVWQMQRLAWKEGVIADIEARIVDAPVALPAQRDPETQSYLPVQASGNFTGDPVRVLVSQKDVGAGYRLISAFLTQADGRALRVMVDRGFVPTAQGDGVPTPDRPVTVTGNLQWPQEVDDFTPAPDMAGNIWFARDVPALAKALEAEPVLIVARDIAPAQSGVSPLPVDTSRIPNDHLQYAITWFSLAAIWLAMSVYFLRRRAAPQES